MSEIESPGVYSFIMTLIKKSKKKNIYYATIFLL